MELSKLLADVRVRAMTWCVGLMMQGKLAAVRLGQQAQRAADTTRSHLAAATVLVCRAALQVKPSAERGWRAVRAVFLAANGTLLASTAGAREIRPWADRAARAAMVWMQRGIARLILFVRIRWVQIQRRLGSLRDRVVDRLNSAATRLRRSPRVPWTEPTGSTQKASSRFSMEIATPFSRHVALASAGLLLGLAALPAFAGRTLLNDLIFMFTMLALAQFWNLLAGYAGLVSVGQQAFVGLGGYLLFTLTIHAGIDALVAIILAGVVAAVFALPTAFVVFRLQGAYFAIGTWVVAEVYRLVLAQSKQLGGGTGTSLPAFVTNEVVGLEWVKSAFGVSTSAARDMITYWMALVLVTGTIFAIYLLLRSRHGLALTAIRDSEGAAESVGIDTFKTKLVVYVMTAAGTGMVGALIYLQKARISPDAAFAVLDWTAYVIFIVVIGGIGTLEGPIVGVLIFYLLQTNFAQFGSWYLMLLGVFAILTMLFAPKGIWGYLSHCFGLRLFPLQRRLKFN